jgi:OmcA/MtrC family decaheme c-type cytochrome
LTESCNECHGRLNIHGRRFEIEYCVTCHNPGLGAGDMTNMTHKIHMGQFLVNGFELGGNVYSDVVFPMNSNTRDGLKNCAKCHSLEEGAPQGDNWKTAPSAAACGSCHDGIDFTNGSHFGQSNNQFCVSCHVDPNGNSVIDIQVAHRTPYSTANNPEVPSWARIAKVEVQNVAIAVDTTPGAAAATATFMVRGLAKQNSDDAFASFDMTNNGTAIGATTRSLSFRIVYSSDGADWDNFLNGGRQYFDDTTGLGISSFDQPTSVTLTDATHLAGGMDADGWYAVTMNFSLSDEAAGELDVAEKAAIGLEGSFRFVDSEGVNQNLRVPGLVVGAGDAEPFAARRQIVSEAKCHECHEYLGFHGSSARNNPDYCVTCHNPLVTNSGQTLANPDEFSMNLKDLVHAIHGAEKRTVPFDFVRGTSAGGSGQGLHEFSEVDFFGRAGECEVCHLPDTYLPETLNTVDGALPSVIAANPQADRATFATNFDDSEFVGPIAGACFACHDSDGALAHMQVNTTQAGLEACSACHGAGKSESVDTVHGN